MFCNTKIATFIGSISTVRDKMPYYISQFSEIENFSTANKAQHSIPKGRKLQTPSRTLVLVLRLLDIWWTGRRGLLYKLKAETFKENYRTIGKA